jgi:hypothetical protein
MAGVQLKGQVSALYSAAVSDQNGTCAPSVRHLTGDLMAFLASDDASLSIRPWT